MLHFVVEYHYRLMSNALIILYGDDVFCDKVN